MNETAYPLSWPQGWPRTKAPGRSRFGTYAKKPRVATALDLLEPELRRLGAVHPIVSTNIQLRRDGLPYSNQKEPQDSGAAVYFTLHKRRCVLACDRWNTVGDNLWAIAKHVETLRAQDRWGVGSVEQAFAGYAALPAKSGPDCWEQLGMNGQPSVALPVSYQEEAVLTAYRQKAKAAHPDVEGGSHEAFTALGQAKDIALATIRSEARRS